MIDYDITRHPARPHEWAALVAAIHTSTEFEENYWLELKSQLDWSKPHGTGTLARAIIGLANRDPERAAAFLGGSGVIIVGLGPGEVFPIEVIDNADLDNKLSTYLGEDGPRWRPEWIKVAGQTILLVEVDAPRNGDPEYTLRSSFGDFRVSQTFVREIGKTTPATEADVKRLAHRHLATDAKEALDVRVGFLLPDPLSTYYWDDARIERYLTDEESHLLGTLAAAQKGQDKPGSTDLTSLIAAASPKELTEALASMDKVRTLGMGLRDDVENPETRSAEKFKAEVAAYIHATRAAFPEALTTIASTIVPLPMFVLTNLSDRNFSEVEVTIRVEGEARAEDTENRPEPVKLRSLLPRRPREFGPHKSPSRFNIGLSALGMSSPYVPAIPSWRDMNPGRRDIRNGGSFDADFDSLDLRPRQAEVVLESNLAVVIPRDRPEPVTVYWQATASNVDAVARGEFVLPFNGDPIDVLGLALGE